MESIVITKVTGQTPVFVMPSSAFEVFGLGLNGSGAFLVGGSVVGGSVVSGLGNDESTCVETGLSLDWSMFGGRIDTREKSMRDERPTEAPKAAVVAARHGRYGAVAGAAAEKKQNEQQIEKMRAFRGPEPWRET